MKVNFVIKNNDGTPVVLNEVEQKEANRITRVVNNLGYEIQIDTLSMVLKKASDQKFFEVRPSLYLPVRVGEGAYASEIVGYRTFSLADDFETGLIANGSNNTKMAMADSGVDVVRTPIKDWAKSIQWSIVDLQRALRAGDFRLIESKEKARKKNWDLGIQRTAFLGLDSDPSVRGLYNLSGVTSNLTLITKPISTMTPTEFDAFITGFFEAYRVNCDRTAKPNMFVIPESDFNGLQSFVNPAYPVNTKFDVLLRAMKNATGDQNFQILPCAYGDDAQSGLGVQRYALYNKDEDSLRMDIPKDYSATLQNTVNGFNFENVAHGEFTGILLIRPDEMLYFDY